MLSVARCPVIYWHTEYVGGHSLVCTCAGSVCNQRFFHLSANVYKNKLIACNAYSNAHICMSSAILFTAGLPTLPISRESPIFE